MRRAEKETSRLPVPGGELVVTREPQPGVQAESWFHVLRVSRSTIRNHRAEIHAEPSLDRGRERRESVN